MIAKQPKGKIAETSTIETTPYNSRPLMTALDTLVEPKSRA